MILGLLEIPPPAKDLRQLKVNPSPRIRIQIHPQTSMEQGQGALGVPRTVQTRRQRTGHLGEIQRLWIVPHDRIIQSPGRLQPAKPELPFGQMEPGPQESHEQPLLEWFEDRYPLASPDQLPGDAFPPKPMPDLGRFDRKFPVSGLDPLFPATHHLPEHPAGTRARSSRIREAGGGCSMKTPLPRPALALITSATVTASKECPPSTRRLP